MRWFSATTRPRLGATDSVVPSAKRTLADETTIADEEVDQRSAPSASVVAEPTVAGT